MRRSVILGLGLVALITASKRRTEISRRSALASGHAGAGQPIAAIPTLAGDRRRPVGSGSSLALATREPGDSLNGTDADGVLAWIDNYCRANPIKDIADAAEAFARYRARGH